MGQLAKKISNLMPEVPSSVASFLLKKLQSEGLIYFKDGLVEIPADSRLRLAVRALQLGADVEQVSDLLAWQEFESMASIALGAQWLRNSQKRSLQKRLETLGNRRHRLQKALVICVDCKQWHHGMHMSSLKKMVEAQSTRVAAFAKSLPNKALDLPCTKWRAAVFVPVILSLIHVNVKFYDEVPVVPVLALQDFIHQLPLNMDAVKSFLEKI